MYYQSNEQKYKIILDNAPTEDSNKDYNINFINRRFNELNRDYSKFVEWHKGKYPNKHLELF